MSTSRKRDWLADRPASADQIDWAHRPPPSFKARYPGICASCEQSIIPGQTVRYDSSDDLIHARHEGQLKPQHTYTICTECFLAKPCECDD